MHLRRALLLFAIVLGLAALASSISRPRSRDSSPPRTETVAPPALTGAVPLNLRLGPATRHHTVAVAAGQAATLEVDVEQAGQVDLPALGLTDAAEPVSPAQFQVLTDAPGRYAVLFTGAEGTQPKRLGTLIVKRRAG